VTSFSTATPPLGTGAFQSKPNSPAGCSTGPMIVPRASTLLARAPQRSMRRVDLSRDVRLSPSGVTRMLDRMEATGLVEKGACKQDARVSYAVLTEAGMDKLQQAWPDHVAAVERLLGQRLDDRELESLKGLLERVARPSDCEPGA
jgi:DNA-binding MarR family transcriptional regulator